MQGSLEGEAGLSLKDTWKYYLQLLIQQDGVIASHADTLSLPMSLQISASEENYFDTCCAWLPK